MKLQWKTEKRKVKDLIPYEQNPRKMDEKQAKELRESIKRFDLVEIPAIDTDNKIIAGHQRLNILLQDNRGEEEIDVRVPNRKLTDKEFREYLLRSNKNTGQWDWDVLANFEAEDLKDVGFTSEELDKNFGLTEEDDFDVDKALEENKETVCKLGDIYQLGTHRLMCGDSTKKEDVEKLMNGMKADMVFTDPPYGVSYADKNKFLNSISPGNRIQEEIMNDHKTVEELQEEIIYPAFCNIYEYLSGEGSYYITAPQGGELLMMMMMMMNHALIPLRHMLIWSKNNHVLGRTDYNYKHEPILYGWKDKHIFYGNGNFTKSVWEIDKPHESKLHPTMKPIELVVNAIKNSSKSEDIIMDLFGGSGSTLIACEQTNRKCYMMELSEKYCDVIIKRWEDYTGKQAIKL